MSDQIPDCGPDHYLINPDPKGPDWPKRATDECCIERNMVWVWEPVGERGSKHFIAGIRYRRVVQSRYDWGKAPEWVQWMATDLKGRINRSADKLIIGLISCVWVHPKLDTDEQEGVYDYETADDATRCLDWRDSQEHRPTPLVAPTTSPDEPLPESTKTLYNFKEVAMPTASSDAEGCLPPDWRTLDRALKRRYIMDHSFATVTIIDNLMSELDTLRAELEEIKLRDEKLFAELRSGLTTISNAMSDNRNE